MAAVLTCGRSECGVSKTGICAEGHTPSEAWPSFGQAIVDVPEEFEDDDDASDVHQVIESARVPLLSGESFVPAQADQFLLWKPVKFVTIVGEFDSGKTTLICALYERFLKGKFANYLFAGSRTLVGFEKRSHHSRIDSGRVVPDTLRTSLSDGLRYFHLSLLQQGAQQSRVELMLSDRAGEQYLKARSNSALVDELIEVKKAHHVVVLLDGGRLADPVQRSGAMQAVRQTIRAFLDGGALTHISKVQVVTTKFDLLKGVEQKENLETQVEKFRTSLVKDFSSRLSGKCG
ncbi:MAG: TRAFAC clade GTPase domain-containing protein [Pseudomonas fluorescens]